MSEPESKRRLQSPWRLRGDRLAEEGRAEIADVARVIHMIQDVDCIEAQRDRRPLVLLGAGKKEIVRPTKIHIRVARPLQAVAGYADGPIIRQPVVVIVTPCRL